MITDLYGKTRFKVNLHTHTTLSDGRRTPAQVAQRYREEDYDAIALTDHWVFGESGEMDGLLILSGAEYNNRAKNSENGVYHIVGVGMNRPASVTMQFPPQKIIDAIHSAGGLAILAHPAWSLNTPQQILALNGIDATEIYNTVSGVHMSRRPDSGLIVDMIGASGRYYPLLAADDAHYYDGDECKSWIMVQAADNTREALLRAVRNGNFYSTQGPEIHICREGNEAVVTCSPCREIIFLSGMVWGPRIFTGEGLTEARYQIAPDDTFLRAEVTDANGKRAWTNIIPIPENT